MLPMSLVEAPRRRVAAARWSISIALGLAGLAAAGCTSRTLPLPPPDVDPLVAPNAQGLVRVQGTGQAGASIGVLNERSLQGMIGTADDKNCGSACPFQIDIQAKSGDPIRVWQFFTTPASRDLKVPK